MVTMVSQETMDLANRMRSNLTIEEAIKLIERYETALWEIVKHTSSYSDSGRIARRALGGKS